MWYLHIHFVCDKLLAFSAIFFLLSLYDRLEYLYCIAIGVFLLWLQASFSRREKQDPPAMLVADKAPSFHLFFQV